MILRFICRTILNVWGWKVETEVPDINKCIIIGGPHTSNTDFIVAILFYLSVNMKISFLIKNDWMKFPFGGLIRSLGGIGVNRSEKTAMTSELVEQYEKRKRFYLIITPEGTRSKVTKWKRGFYYIAKAANVPVMLGYMDYKKKTMGIADVHYVLDDIDAEMLRIKKFFATINPKYPENFSIGLDE